MPTDPAPPSWWTLLMSGADNRTPAIGRVLGALLFAVLLLMLPAVIVGVLLLRGVDWPIWAALLSSLIPYVPAMVGTIAGLIRWTHPTEPPGPSGPPGGGTP